MSLPNHLQNRSAKFRAGYLACQRGQDRGISVDGEWTAGWDVCRAQKFVDDDLRYVSFPDAEMEEVEVV